MKVVTGFGLVTLPSLLDLLTSLPWDPDNKPGPDQIERLASVLQLHHDKGIDRLYSSQLMTMAFALTGEPFEPYEQVMDQAWWSKPAVMAEQIGMQPTVEIADDLYTTIDAVYWLFERWMETLPFAPVYTLEQLRTAVESGERLLDNATYMVAASNDAVH